MEFRNKTSQEKLSPKRVREKNEKGHMHPETAVVGAFTGLVLGFIALGIGSEVANRPPKHYDGTVTAKSYDDPDTYTTFVSTGKTTVPMTTYDDEHWNLKVKTRDDEDGSYKTYNVEVKQKQYDKIAVGDHVHVDDGVVSSENNG